MHPKIIQTVLIGGVLLGALITYAIFEETYGALRIELVRCTPDGFINSLRAKVRPKYFWIDQDVTLEMEFKREWEFKNSLDMCKEGTDKANTERCLDYYNNFRNSLRRCHVTIKKRCRESGGFC
jgi:hypothetical protein